MVNLFAFPKSVIALRDRRIRIPGCLSQPLPYFGRPPVDDYSTRRRVRGTWWDLRIPYPTSVPLYITKKTHRRLPPTGIESNTRTRSRNSLNSTVFRITK